MKLFLKILKIVLILLVTVSVLLFSASIMLQDKVAGIILNSLNKNISTRLDVGSFRLSFLRKFPKASLELKNVLVHSSSDFDSGEFKGINTDTLLAARLVSVEFNIKNIINGNYTIESVTARGGKANFYTDTAGRVNYDISMKSTGSENKSFTINLEKINISDIKSYYNNLSAKLIMNGLVKTGKLKSRITGSNIDFMAVAQMEINRFQLFSTTITKTIKTSLDVTLQSTKTGIRFKKGSLSFEKNEFSIEGLVSSDDVLDLNISGQNIDIAKIRNYLPEKYQSLVSDYNPSGILIVDCKIKGPLTRTKNPHIEINCKLNNGHISYGKSDVTINRLSFAARYTNGLKNNVETSSATFKDIAFNLGRSGYTGSFLITGFHHPQTQINLKGRVFPGDLKKFFNLQKISFVEGSVDVDFKLITNFWPKDSVTINDLIALRPQANLVFNSFSIGLLRNNAEVRNVNGNVSYSQVISAKNLNFNYKGQNIKINGSFRNLPEWLAGNPVIMAASADVSFNRFIPEVFLETPLHTGTSMVMNKAVKFPGNVALDINFKIDSLRYKTFSSSDIEGTLNYKPRLLTFKSLNMHSLNGTISGSGFITQNISKSIIGRANFTLAGIDIKKAFHTFHNFGQDFIKAENLSGNLSGSLSVLLPADSILVPQIKSVTAEGKFVLTDGALINFEPVKQLSSFIELSELENIHFDRLENDFFIRDNYLYLPQMDVRSSAADLSVNGKHSFDNDYEYHVKMLLSELLSKKRKRTRTSNTEFGVVEDDGLGRTSILLKVVNKGDDFKVGYDMKAAGAEIKNNMKAERQSLKTILKQEYGWFKNDTAAAQIPAEKKTKFRISWDDGDSTKIINEAPVAKKESGVKSLFKKK